MGSVYIYIQYTISYIFRADGETGQMISSKKFIWKNEFGKQTRGPIS